LNLTPFDALTHLPPLTSKDSLNMLAARVILLFLLALFPSKEVDAVPRYGLRYRETTKRRDVREVTKNAGAKARKRQQNIADQAPRRRTNEYVGCGKAGKAGKAGSSYQSGKAGKAGSSYGKGTGRRTMSSYGKAGGKGYEYCNDDFTEPVEFDDQFLTEPDVPDTGEETYPPQEPLEDDDYVPEDDDIVSVDPPDWDDYVPEDDDLVGDDGLPPQEPLDDGEESPSNEGIDVTGGGGDSVSNDEESPSNEGVDRIASHQSGLGIPGLPELNELFDYDEIPPSNDPF
jgi:hypothetical protein